MPKDDEIFLTRKDVARRCYPRKSGNPWGDLGGEVFDEPFDDWTARVTHNWDTAITKQKKVLLRLRAHPQMQDFVWERLKGRMEERLPRDERGNYQVTAAQADLFISDCVDPLPGRYTIPRGDRGTFIKRESQT